MFWKPTIEGYQLAAVSMGLFDGPTGLHLSKHTFVEDKGDYYEITDGLRPHLHAHSIKRNPDGSVKRVKVWRNALASRT